MIRLIIGVSDEAGDTAKIKSMDSISPRGVGHRSVVGARREMVVLGEAPAVFFGRWKNGIKNSELSSPLKEEVLSSMSHHDYFGRGVIIISIPRQTTLSFVGSEIYLRSGDDTVLASDGKTIAGVVSRFAQPHRVANPLRYNVEN